MNSKYSGMTVNERLFKAELLYDFDEAAKLRNKTRMVEILQKVDLTDAQANETYEEIIKNPSKFDY